MTAGDRTEVSAAQLAAAGTPPLFPEDFLWGGATSNVQGEGGIAEGGKGLSVYDTLVVTPEPGIEPVYSDTAVASDHYHRYREDIALMGELGMKAHRFSIVWSRIFPNGDETEPNQAGLAFYEDMVDALRENGIEPVASLLHFDMPDNLRVTRNGFESRETIDLHTRFVKAVVGRLRGKVTYWITYNEINTAPFFPRLVAGSERPETAQKVDYEATIRHHTLLAQAQAASAIRTLQSDAQVGCMIYYGPSYPASSDPRDVTAARFLNDSVFHVPLDVMAHGEYSTFYRRFLERRGSSIPEQSGDAEILRAGAEVLDYISFSYYQTAVASHPDTGNEVADEDALMAGFFSGSQPNPHLDRNEWGWQIDPEGIRTAAAQLYARYRKPVFVVENGIGIDEQPDESGVVQDDARIAYHRGHVRALADAIHIDGVPVIGYLAWSPFDILSSHKEMRKRYGFIHINRTHDDLRDLKRTPKKSFWWYRDVIASRGASALEGD